MKLRKEIKKLAVKDFYGRSCPEATRVIRYLNKNGRPKLTEEEKDAVWHIRTNLTDKVYRDNLTESLSG